MRQAKLEPRGPQGQADVPEGASEEAVTGPEGRIRPAGLTVWWGKTLPARLPSQIRELGK